MSDELKIDLTGIVEEDDGEEQEEAEDGSPGRLAGLLAPVAGIGARLAGPLAPVLRLFTLVPLPILSAAGSALGVLLLVLIVMTLTGSVRAAADAKEVADTHAEATHDDDHDTEPIIRMLARNNAPTVTPQPTATPIPPLWEPRDSGGFIVRGAPLPDPVQILQRNRLWLVDDARERYTIKSTFAITLRSGPQSPWFGFILAYLDESHHVNLQFSSNSYANDLPQATLMVANGAEWTRSGETVGMPFEFWGRDTHEVRVAVNDTEVRAWVDNRTVARWPNPKKYPNGTKGMFLLGGSRMRVDSFTIQ